MKRLLFMAFSAFLLTATLSSIELQELREERAALSEKIDVHLREISAIEAALEEAEAEKRRLTRILENRQLTYRAAVELHGSVFPVLSMSGFSADLFERVWETHGADQLKGTGEAFMQAERVTGVNALVLAAIAVHETGWGWSALARNKNNLFGWGAAGPDPYRAALAFNSREEGIIYVAESIREDYLSRDGRYYYGDNLKAMNVCYAADRGWAGKVARLMAVIARAAVANPDELYEK